MNVNKSLNIPERFRNHPIFTELNRSVNFGFLARRGYFSQKWVLEQPARIKAAGANWVTLNTHFCQETFASTHVFLDFDWSSGEVELTEIVKELHKQGLHILLKPCLTNLDSSWMGSVDFPLKCEQQIQGRRNHYWEDWFGSLRECLRYFAEFSEKNGIEGIIIGAEYNGTTDIEDEWEKTIDHVRKYYSGPITYEFMTGELERHSMEWMKKLDFLAISFYPSASGTTWEERYDRDNWKNLPPCSLVDMKKHLVEYPDKIAAVSKKFGNKPVLFTEIGCRSTRGSTMLAWEFLTKSQWDGDEQANYMRAILDTFSGLDCWMGLSWWKWDETQHDREHYNPDPLLDRGFTIDGKPAAKVFKEWHAPWRPKERLCGFNLLGMFCKTKMETGDKRISGCFSEEHFRWIHDWGFNFVRLPLDYRFFIKDGDWMKLDEGQLKKLDDAVAYGKKYGIHVNINFHRAPGYCCNPPQEPQSLYTDTEPQTAFTNLWAALAKRYRGIPNDELTFDLVNEPADMFGGTSANYAAVAKAAIDAIRAIDSERFIMSDGWGYGNQPTPELRPLPFNVGESIHCYTPHTITHYKAPFATWLGEQKECPPWPPEGCESGREWLLNNYFNNWKSAESEHCFLHLSEFGTYSGCPHDKALVWLEDILSIAKEKNIGWALWNLNGMFGIIDSGRTDCELEDFEGHTLDRAELNLLQKYK